MSLRRFFRHPLGNRDSGIRQILRRAEKVVRKEVLPIAAPILGAAVAGPVGAVAGGAAAGAIRSSHNVGENAVKGGLKGLAIGGGLSLAQNFLAPQSAMQTLAKRGLLGNLMGPINPLGLKVPTLAGALGMGDEMAGNGGLSRLTSGIMPKFVNSYFKNGYSAGDEGGGLLDSLGINPLDALLMGGALAGNLGSKTTKDKKEEEEFNKIANPKHPHDSLPQPKFSPYSRQPNPNYGHNIDYDRHIFGGEKAFFNDLPPIPHYAQGGYVHGGYIHGDSGGRQDDFDAFIPEGSYVQDATTVSLLGDGNSENGKRKLDDLRDRFLESGITSYRSWNDTKPVKVKLSRGEVVLEPEVVKGIGRGSEKKGVKKLEKMRKEIRREKGVKKFLPPKSKPLTSYLR